MSNQQFRRPPMPGRPAWRSESDPRLQINSGVDDYMHVDIDKQCDEIAARTAAKLVKQFEFPEEKCARFKDMMVGVAQYHYYQIANKVYKIEQDKARDAVDGVEKNAEERIKKAQESVRQEKYDLGQWVDQYQKTANDAEDRATSAEEQLGKLQRVEEELVEERKETSFLKGEVEENEMHVKQLQEEIDEWKEKYEKVEGDKKEADAVEMEMRHKKEAMERELRQFRTETEEKQRRLQEAVENAEQEKKDAIKNFDVNKEELQKANDAKDELRSRVGDAEKAKRALERDKAELQSNINGLREELQRANYDAKADQKKALSKLRKEKDREIEALNKTIGDLSKELSQLKAWQKDDDEQKTADRDALAKLRDTHEREINRLNSEIRRLSEDKERLDEEVGLLRAKEQNDDKVKTVEKELADLKAWREEKAEQIEEARRGQLDPDDKTLFQVVPPVLKELVRLKRGANLSDHGITSDHQLEAFGRLLGPLEIDEYVKLHEKVGAITNRAPKDAETLKGAIQKVLQGMGEAHAEHVEKNQATLLGLMGAANKDVLRATEDAHGAKKELAKLREDLKATEDTRKELHREKSELNTKLNKLESSLKQLTKEKDELEVQMKNPRLTGEDSAEIKKKYADMTVEKHSLENRCTEKTKQIEKKDKELRDAQGHLREARDHIQLMVEQTSAREELTKQYEKGASKTSEILADLEVNLGLAHKAKKMAVGRAAKAEKELQGIRDEVEPPGCPDLKAEVKKLVRFRKAREDGQEAIKKLDELQRYQDAIERILETNAVLDLKHSAAVIDMYAQKVTRVTNQFEQRRREQPNGEDPELFSRIAKNRRDGRNLEKVRDRLRAGIVFVEDLLDKSKNKVKAKGGAPETEPSTPMSIAPDSPSRITDMVMAPISLTQRNQQDQFFSGRLSLFTLVNSVALFCMLAAIVAEGQKYGQWKSANSYTRGLYAEQRNYMCASMPHMVFFTDWIWALVTMK